MSQILGFFVCFGRWHNFLYSSFKGESCCILLSVWKHILNRDGKIGLCWKDIDCLLAVLLVYFWSVLGLESIYPWGLFSPLHHPEQTCSSPPAIRIFCCSVSLSLFIYLHRGAAPWGMTQMFKNRSAWLVRGGHKPRQCFPRVSSPFWFLLFSLLSDICLQELRDCSWDFFFSFVRGW